VYSTNIFTALNVSAITSLLDEYTAGVPALFADTVIPEDCTAMKTINFYQVGMIDLALNYIQATYSVNCRAPTQTEAETIAAAVVGSVNRTSYTEFFTNCQLGAPIPPADATDVYNIPIEITFKKRN